MADIRKLQPVPLVAWAATGILSLAIVGNAFFGQPAGNRFVSSATTDAVQTGSARLHVEAPTGSGRTIQLKYDPVVETVQRELAATGYYKGMVDGVSGRKTRQAIEDYQRSVGLEVNGQPSQDLVDHIRFTREVSEASLFTGSTKPDPEADSRARVRRVQTGLAELAYAPGAISGEMTRQTRNAIKEFQRDRKLPETGEITDDLIAELGKMSGQSELATE